MYFIAIEYISNSHLFFSSYLREAAKKFFLVAMATMAFPSPLFELPPPPS